MRNGGGSVAAWPDPKKLLDAGERETYSHQPNDPKSRVGSGIPPPHFLKVMLHCLVGIYTFLFLKKPGFKNKLCSFYGTKW